MLHQLANDYKVADIIQLSHPYPQTLAKEWIASHPGLITSGKEYPFAVIEKGSGILAGTIALRIHETQKKGDLGYWIGSRFGGRGYAADAVNQLLTIGFESLTLHKIEAIALSKNKATIAVLKKAGLAWEAHLKDHLFINQTYEDAECYCMSQSSYI
ncbi:GNAT family N-acetyltransferase [Bacillus sp. 1P06AnD]|uniref:GNAT family N-acetyltransferase n=1 Tax=Bacillus sp. 1P06AnD TaxID=3132208 RepID=UPI0039A2104F